MLASSKYITFDDVLIEPNFSLISSRKDVDITTNIGSLKLESPILAANMDTIFSIELAISLANAGGCAVVHRFCSIEENVAICQQLQATRMPVIASIGINESEYERAAALIESGVNYLCIDVAHGAQMTVVEHYNKLIKNFGDKVEIIVGNFATGQSIQRFRELCHREPMAFKIGIGGGSACLTRVQTGCGVPQLSAILDCAKINPNSNLISDGAQRHPGDIAKALAAGAKAVMLGFMFAGTDEAPGEVIENKFKKYRGSASLESYRIQGKESAWRTFEGDSFLVPLKGPVANIVQNINGGLRSAFTYVGARNLAEFQEHATLIKVSGSSYNENTSHGKQY